MTPWYHLCWLLVLAGQTGLPLGASVVEVEATNIIFVLADDQGWSDASYQAVPNRQYQPGAGGTRWQPNPPHTPHLDEMAHSNHTLLLHRFYAGAPVCSPTRSSILTGRTPDRECIFGAEGCGQQPAWLCADKMPLPPTTFTAAEAAREAGMATIHIGKWHLGNFFPKPELGPKHPSFAYEKWPTSHPGMHGFDQWHSTEASASSTMCNCGCRPEWIAEGQGCVIGGGVYQHKAFPCTNYWYPKADGIAEQSNCLSPQNATLDCVANLTTKIPGDDSEYILDVFEAFLKKQVDSKTPFMAHLWLHTVHEPHPSLPEFYFAYNDTYGKPAGDYLGTLTQMDVQIGRLRAMLKQYDVYNDTLVWYTSDNGPHPGDNLEDVRSATNGLRQCKASVFEGGIREPGMIEWPAGITSHSESWVPVSTVDFLPTVLDLLQVKAPNPQWISDGESVLPLIEATVQAPSRITGSSSISSGPTTSSSSSSATIRAFNRSKPLGWRFGEQLAWIDGDYKLVYNPGKGQCAWEAPWVDEPKKRIGPHLFQLATDPTESRPVEQAEPQRFKDMWEALLAWNRTIAYSQQMESQCEPVSPTDP